MVAAEDENPDSEQELFCCTIFLFRRFAQLKLLDMKK